MPRQITWRGNDAAAKQTVNTSEFQNSVRDGAFFFKKNFIYTGDAHVPPQQHFTARQYGSVTPARCSRRRPPMAPPQLLDASGPPQLTFKRLQRENETREVCRVKEDFSFCYYSSLFVENSPRWRLQMSRFVSPNSPKPPDVQFTVILSKKADPGTWNKRIVWQFFLIRVCG